MINVTLYTKANCAGCEEVKTFLDELKTDYPHRVITIDVATDVYLAEKYEALAPVVQIGPYRLKTNISRQELQVALAAATDRVHQLELNTEKELAENQVPTQLTTADKISLWLSKGYLWLFNFWFVLFIGLAFLAPVFERSGWTTPAEIIYRVYSPLCHQLAYRSWFLFGEQPYYPRALAEIPGVKSYEEAFSMDSFDLVSARNIEGNATVGYKVALCQRDIAIYGSMIVFGLLYALTGRRLRSIPWYVWLLLGVAPMGLDGVSQLPSVAHGLPSWMVIRESTPLLRTVTGSMFGWFTAWYLYPMIEDAMRETHRMLLRKKAFIEQTTQQSAG